MPQQNLEVGQIAQDVAEQVAETVADSIATSKTNQLLQNAAAAEASRQAAEQDRVDAEAERAAAETARETEFSSWEDEIDSKLTRGDYDAMTGVGYADNADQLNSPDVTVDQAPYLFRTSGGDADIGNREKDTIVGGSLGWNQLIKNGNFESTSDWAVTNGTFEVSSNIGTYTITTVGSSIYGNRIAQDIGPQVAGHKVLVSLEVMSSRAGQRIGVSKESWGTTGAVATCANANTWYKALAILEAPVNYWIRVLDYQNSQVGDTMSIRNAQLFDLTAIFGATIADYVYSLETATAGAGVAWFRKYFPKSYYPYKAIGGFLHVKLTSHDMVHFNQFDIDAIYSQTYATVTISGMQITLTGTYYASWAIRLMKGMAYYIRADVRGALTNGMFRFVYEDGALSESIYSKNSTFTPTKDVKAVLIYASDNGTSKTTVYSNVNINLSWSGWRNGQYEAYKKNSYPLDTSVILRGIPRLDANNNLYYDGDLYESSGKVTGKYGIVDLGTLTFIRGLWDGVYQFDAPLAGAKPSGKAFCVRYPRVDYATLIGANGNNSLYISNSGGVDIRADDYSDAASFKSAMSGVYLIYELATPTEETANPFQEVQEVDDFGTEEYVVPEQDGVSVPVGHYTEYPENLRDKLRRLPNMPTVSESTTATYAVNYNGQTKKCSFVPINDWLVANGYPTGDALKEVLASKEALGGTLRQLLAVKESLDFDNTAFVDLGEQSWTYNGTTKRFSFILSNAKIDSSWNGCKNICSKYKTGAVSSDASTNNQIGINGGTVYVSDNSYTDATAFKAAMKGVLLAYGKASS